MFSVSDILRNMYASRLISIIRKIGKWIVTFILFCSVILVYLIVFLQIYFYMHPSPGKYVPSNDIRMLKERMMERGEKTRQKRAGKIE